MRSGSEIGSHRLVECRLFTVHWMIGVVRNRSNLDDVSDTVMLGDDGWGIVRD